MQPKSRRWMVWFLAVALVAGLILWWFWPTLFPSGPRYDRWLSEP
jgi:hypothetical protein